MDQPILRDIHLPDDSLWWPPAPGWWLALLALSMLVVMLPWLYRWWRHKPLWRLSLRELERIRLGHKAGQGDKAVLNDLAALLRRVTISYYGRERQAATTGDAWLAQLRRLAPGAGFSEQQLELLAHGRYRARCDADIESLLRASERWMRALPRGRGRVPA